MEDKCPLCGSTKVVYVDGEVVCSNCGAVLRQVETVGVRFKQRPREQFNTGAPLKHFSLERLDRSDMDVKMMKNYASQLSVPSVVQDEAEALIRKLYKSRKRPNDPTGVALGTLYIAMRIHNIPVSYADMKKLGLRGRTLNRIVKVLNPKLPPQAPEVFLEKYASLLGLDERAVREAIKILKARRTHTNPKIEAIAALYVVQHDGEKKPVPVFARTAGISPTALWKTVKILIESAEHVG